MPIRSRHEASTRGRPLLERSAGNGWRHRARARAPETQNKNAGRFPADDSCGRGSNTNDTRQRIVSSYMIELPFGHEPRHERRRHLETKRCWKPCYVINQQRGPSFRPAFCFRGLDRGTSCG